MEEDDCDLEKYDTFFDYEDELAGLKPSGEQYVEMIDPDPFVVMEDNAEDSFGPVVMEEPDKVVAPQKKEGSSLSVDNNENKKYTDVVGFEFVQCDFVKDDGNRCKRQAPKGNTICSTHKRYIKKHDIK
jgi:hypothetical protein